MNNKYKNNNKFSSQEKKKKIVTLQSQKIKKYLGYIVEIA